MASEPHDRARRESGAKSTPDLRVTRRIYQKPRIERFGGLFLILGNVTGNPDGLSGSERPIQA